MAARAGEFFFNSNWSASELAETDAQLPLPMRPDALCCSTRCLCNQHNACEAAQQWIMSNVTSCCAGPNPQFDRRLVGHSSAEHATADTTRSVYCALSPLFFEAMVRACEMLAQPSGACITVRRHVLEALATCLRRNVPSSVCFLPSRELGTRGSSRQP